MMILYTTFTSPYGRKVRVAIMRAGFANQVERRDAILGGTDDPISAHNSLGKVPCLVLENSEAIFDSPVIVEQIDYRSSGKLLLREPEARMLTLRIQALADGLMDASIAMMIEGRFRPAEHVSPQ